MYVHTSPKVIGTSTYIRYVRMHVHFIQTYASQDNTENKGVLWCIVIRHSSAYKHNKNVIQMPKVHYTKDCGNCLSTYYVAPIWKTSVAQTHVSTR